MIALGTDVEGDATTYLAKRLSGRGFQLLESLTVCPAGSGLEFADELTLVALWKEGAN